MKNILLGSNSPTLTVQNRHECSSETHVKIRDSRQNLCSNEVAQLSEEDLFRLSLQEIEPKKCLPPPSIVPLLRQHSSKSASELSDADLFRCSLSEAEPKKCFQAAHVSADDALVLHGLKVAEPQSSARASKPGRFSDDLSNISEVDLFRRCMRETEPKKLLPLSSPAATYPRRATDSLPHLADADLFRRCLDEPEPTKPLPTPPAPPTKRAPKASPRPLAEHPATEPVAGA